MENWANQLCALDIRWYHRIFIYISCEKGIVVIRISLFKEMLKYLRIKIKMNGLTKNMYAHIQKEKYDKTIIGGSRIRMGVYCTLNFFVWMKMKK